MTHQGSPAQEGITGKVKCPFPRFNLLSQKNMLLRIFWENIRAIKSKGQTHQAPAPRETSILHVFYYLTLTTAKQQNQHSPSIDGETGSRSLPSQEMARIKMNSGTRQSPNPSKFRGFKAQEKKSIASRDTFLKLVSQGHRKAHYSGESKANNGDCLFAVSSQQCVLKKFM